MMLACIPQILGCLQLIYYRVNFYVNSILLSSSMSIPFLFSTHYLSVFKKHSPSPSNHHHNEQGHETPHVSQSNLQHTCCEPRHNEIGSLLAIQKL